MLGYTALEPKLLRKSDCCHLIFVNTRPHNSTIILVHDTIICFRKSGSGNTDIRTAAIFFLYICLLIFLQLSPCISACSHTCALAFHAILVSSHNTLFTSCDIGFILTMGVFTTAPNLACILSCPSLHTVHCHNPSDAASYAAPFLHSLTQILVTSRTVVVFLEFTSANARRSSGVRGRLVLGRGIAFCCGCRTILAAAVPLVSLPLYLSLPLSLPLPVSLSLPMALSLPVSLSLPISLSLPVYLFLPLSLPLPLQLPYIIGPRTMITMRGMRDVVVLDYDAGYARCGCLGQQTAESIQAALNKKRLRTVRMTQKR